MAEPTLVLALVAGVASFLSPCMLPVIPAFFAQLAGTSLDEDLTRRDVLSNTALFVAGFAIVFALLGVLLNAVFGATGAAALTWFSRIAGVLIIVLGLHLMGLLHVPILDREYSLRSETLKPGALTSLLFGGAFAVAWTPCVGPILGSTLVLAASQPASAFPLLFTYAVGLGTPFLLVGLFPDRGFAFIERHRRHAARVHTAFGAVLIGMGVLVFTGKLALLANFAVLSEVLT